MENKDFFDSRVFKTAVLTIAGLIVVIFIFNLGVVVGTKRAEFSFKWADQYHRNFAGPQGGFFSDMMMMNDEFTEANGIFGQIIKINDGSLTIKNKNIASSIVEKIVLVNDKTTIVYQRKNIKLSELKIGDNIIVIGEPNNNGQIQAHLIRIIPPPPQNLILSNEPATSGN